MVKPSIRIFILFLAAVVLISCGGRKETLPPERLVLVTDLGTQDPYAAQLKGTIRSLDADIEIIDGHHRIPPFDVVSGSYQLDKIAQSFPARTAFVVVVDPGFGGGSCRGVVVWTKAGKAYIAPDNGVLTRVLRREGVAEARVIENKKLFLKNAPSAAHHGCQVLAPVAVHLAKGLKPDKVGAKAGELVKHDWPEPTVMGSTITGEIVREDRFGRVTTNITAKEVEELKEGQLIKIIYHKEEYTVPFCRSLAEAPEKRLFAFLNSEGELELAYQGKPAARVIGALAGEQIIVKF